MGTSCIYTMRSGHVLLTSGTTVNFPCLSTPGAMKHWPDVTVVLLCLSLCELTRANHATHLARQGHRQGMGRGRGQGHVRSHNHGHSHRQ